MIKADAKRHYTGASGEEYHASFAIPEATVPWVARERAKKTARFLAPSDTVLEYGVGYGWNLSQANCKKRLGFDVASHVEPYVRALGIEFVPATSRIGDGTLDAVVCHHALEHVISPSEALVEMRRMLRPGGKLLLFVPYEKERRYRRFQRGEPNHHLYSWNVQSLANLLEELGFDVADARVGQYGYDRFSAVWASRLRAGRAGYRVLRQMLHLVRPGLEVQVVAAKK